MISVSRVTRQSLMQHLPDRLFGSQRDGIRRMQKMLFPPNYTSIDVKGWSLECFDPFNYLGGWRLSLFAACQQSCGLMYTRFGGLCQLAARIDPAPQGRSSTRLGSPASLSAFAAPSCISRQFERRRSPAGLVFLQILIGHAAGSYSREFQLDRFGFGHRRARRLGLSGPENAKVGSSACQRVFQIS